MCAFAETRLTAQVRPPALFFYEKRIKTPFSVNNEINGFFRFSALCEFVIMFKW
ncbi:hypothetical protein A4A36_06480 [Bacillus subtilis]|nr:hypothetical protein BG616_03115 [Bacillus subtilis]OIS62900.1 hypothetical protein A4A36_06480 [Bacillus subtilis]OIS67544.1 hypothetical protein A4A37_16025 [Bacillus subtilis]OIS69031.1 hypothetical protein A4A35_07980 [Bacillus subtilis]